VRPHDLLRLVPTSPLLGGDVDEAPAWVSDSLSRAPWVVVRRGHCDPQRIPVGVRGGSRAQRWATTIPLDDVAAVRTPESLVCADRMRSLPQVPAATTLLAMAPHLTERWPAWGPTGATGFALATGRSVLTSTSDLDLVIRCHERPAALALDALAGLAAAHVARVDCLLDTPAGLAHLDELRRGRPCLVRTSGGVAVCEDPWAAAEP
jgi:phosphoribosyl-dephospho-CoA transferase